MDTTAERKYGPVGGNPERRSESDQAVEWAVKLKKVEAETKSVCRTAASRDTEETPLQDTFVEWRRSNLSEMVQK